MYLTGLRIPVVEEVDAVTLTILRARLPLALVTDKLLLDSHILSIHHGQCGARTHDLILVRDALYRLS